MRIADAQRVGGLALLRPLPTGRRLNRLAEPRREGDEVGEFVDLIGVEFIGEP